MRFLPLLRLAAAIAVLTGLAPAQRTSTLLQANARIQAAVQAGPQAQAQLHAALAARKALLLDLFRHDPAGARASALPLSTRQALLAADPTLAPLLEYELTKTGELTQSVADSWTDGTSSTLLTLHTPTAELDLALPAAVLATAPLNHHLATVRGLALGDLVAADTLAEATPADAASCAPPVSSRPFATTGSAANAAPLTCSALGNQRIAALIVKFPAATPAFPTGLDQAAYWNQVLFGQNPSVNTYWQEVSQGQTYATGDVYGPFQLSAQYDCTTTSAMQTAAIAAATGTVDFSQYNRVVIVYPVTTCSFGALANVGCVSATGTINHQYSVVWLPISSTYKADFSYPQMWGGTSHELGHNLGMNHANTLDFNAIALGPLDFSTTNPGTVTGYGGGTGTGTGTGSDLAAVNTEYGENFDVMGYPWISGGPYNAVHRAKTLGWIAGADERDVTTSGTFTLVPAENASGLRALHVLRDPTSTSWLWLEYHQPTGYYEANNFTAHGKDGDTETTGAQIHYETPIGPSAYTYLLDMTPVASATAGTNNFYDGTLAPGTSWSDPYSLLTLTAGTQTSAGLNVTVSYDTPCARLSLSTGTALAPTGGTGSLTITAPSTCAWTASTNAPWFTFTGTTSGSGSGVVPFTTSYNTTGAQRNTYLTAQRQSIAFTQPGFSTTFNSIAPNQGTSVASTPTPFVLSYSDAVGPFDTTQVNLNFTGFANPDCQVTVVLNSGKPYLYLYSNGAYTSGLAIGTPGTLASPSCTVSGSGSSYTYVAGSATLNLNLTFTSTFLGEHNILVSALGNTANTASYPLGIWTVTAASLNTLTTSLIASPATSSLGQAVTLTATVSPSTATGTVSFRYSTAPSGAAAMTLGSAPVVNSSATFITSALPTGAGYVFAAYSSGSSVPGSTSPAVAVTVTAATTVTTTTLTGPAAGIVPSGSATLVAHVIPGSGLTQPTGNVSFSDGSTVVATVALNAGAATYTASGLALGTHSFTAAYAGSLNAYAGSTSNPFPVLVALAPAALTLGTSAAAIFPNGSVQITATAASTSGLTPAGSIAFTDGSTTLATVALINGTASFTATGLATGPHALGSTLLPSPDFSAASSVQLPLAVQDFSLTLPNASATLNAGTGESIPLTLSPAAGGFTSPIALTCTGAPAQSTCSVSPTGLTPGTGPATATLTLNTTARPAPTPGWLLLGLSPGLLAFHRRNRKRLATLLTACAAFAVLTLFSGCGQGNFAGFPASGGVGGTPAGTYPLTLTGTATGTTVLTHTTTLSLKVN